MEPFLMTLREHCKLSGSICYHVDDVMVARTNQNTSFRNGHGCTEALYELVPWEHDEFEMCGRRVNQNNNEVIENTATVPETFN